MRGARGRRGRGGGVVGRRVPSPTRSAAVCAAVRARYCSSHRTRHTHDHARRGAPVSSGRHARRPGGVVAACGTARAVQPHVSRGGPARAGSCVQPAERPYPGPRGERRYARAPKRGRRTSARGTAGRDGQWEGGRPAGWERRTNDGPRTSFSAATLCATSTTRVTVDTFSLGCGRCTIPPPLRVAGRFSCPADWLPLPVDQRALGGPTTHVSAHEGRNALHTAGESSLSAAAQARPTPSVFHWSSARPPVAAAAHV